VLECVQTSHGKCTSAALNLLAWRREAGMVPPVASRSLFCNDAIYNLYRFDRPECGIAENGYRSWVKAAEEVTKLFVFNLSLHLSSCFVLAHIACHSARQYAVRPHVDFAVHACCSHQSRTCSAGVKVGTSWDRCGSTQYRNFARKVALGAQIPAAVKKHSN